MRALIVVDHGSRVPSSNHETEQLCDIISEIAGVQGIVLLAHLEFARPTIAEAIDQAVARGADDLVVLPYFLGSGRHATEDVPRLARAAAAKHAGVKITLGRALGPSRQVAEILLRNAGL